MKRNILLFILTITSAWCAVDIDHTQVRREAQKMLAARRTKDAVANTALACSAAALCGCVAWWLCSVDEYSSIARNLTPELLEKIKEQLESVKPKRHWALSTSIAAAKLAAMGIFQSVVTQPLQPIYARIKGYFSSMTTTPAHHSWFLHEQIQQQSADGLVANQVSASMVNTSYELRDFAMHLEGLEHAYRMHDVELIKQEAYALLSNLLFTQEYETQYVFQKRRIHMCYDRLAEHVQQLIDDACQGIDDDKHSDEYKVTVRTLYGVSAYSIV